MNTSAFPVNAASANQLYCVLLVYILNFLSKQLQAVNCLSPVDLAVTNYERNYNT